MRNLIRLHVTHHDRLVAEGGSPFQQRSRQQAWCQNTQGHLDLSQELREALRGLPCMSQNFSTSRLLTLIFLCSGGLDHTDGCDCSNGLFLCNFDRWSAWITSCSRRRTACCASCNKTPCLASSLASVSLSIGSWNEVNAPLPMIK